MCIVEVKRDDVTSGEARLQMLEYMKRAIDHPSREPNLRGYLVEANQVTPYLVVRRGFCWVVEQGETFDMFAAGDRFTTELCEIAIQTWNHQS